MDTDDSATGGTDTPEIDRVEVEFGPLTTVGNYGTPQEAAIARGILRDNGIPAFVQGSETATTLFYVGTALGGVRLDVPESRAEEAERLLSEKFDNADVIPAWTCPKCGAEVDAGFGICWQCSAAYSDVTSAAPTAGSPRENKACKGSDRSEDVGRTVPAQQRDAENRNWGDEIVDRAFRAAVFGILLFPFSFYSLYLLGDARNAPRSDRSRTRLVLAHVLAYLPIVAFLSFFLILVVDMLWDVPPVSPPIDVFPDKP